MLITQEATTNLVVTTKVDNLNKEKDMINCLFLFFHNGDVFDNL